MKTRFLYSIFLLAFIQSSFCQITNNDIKLQSNITTINYVVDSSNSFSISNIQSNDGWKENESNEIINFANTIYPVWIELIFDQNEINNYISFENPMIDELDLYYVYSHQEIDSFTTGSKEPFIQRQINDVNFSFKLPKKPAKIIARLKSNFPLQVPIKLNNYESLLERNHHNDTSKGIYLGVMLVMILYNLFIFISVRDRSYLYYIGYIIFASLLYSTFNGYSFQYLWPDTPYINFLIPSISSITTIFITIFTINFLETKLHLKKLTYLLYGFIGLFTICICINLSGNYHLSAIISQSGSLLFSFLLILVGFLSLKRGVKYAKFYLLAWTLYLISVIVFIAQLNGAIPHNEFTKNSVLWGSAIEAILLSFALANRINIYKSQKEKAQRKVLVELQEKKRIINERNKYLDEKVSERTQELNDANFLLSKKNEEKTAMMKEIHHRVKNNLQVVNSLLRLQSHEIKDERIVKLFEESQNRVVSMAMLHEKMYQSNDLKKIDVKDHFTLLAEDLMSSYKLDKKIQLKIEIENIDIGMKTIVPLGLILNEMISNSLKHAFEDQESGLITIKLSSMAQNKFELIVGDNGLGLKEVQIDAKPSFGQELIEIFSEQVNGQVERMKEEGTFYRMIFEKA